MATKKIPDNKKVKPIILRRQGGDAKVQAALYQIADAASAVTDMQSFYKKMHTIVGKLMYARNFFIALHDEKSNLITWPYHADVKDTEAIWGPQPMADYRGGTAYLLRNDQTVWMKRDYKRMLKSGQFEQTGPASADFIGIPLKSSNKILGALVVQSYTSRHTYTKQDVEILSFVAQHISTALTRARAIEETRQRNSELAILNSVGEAMSKTLDVKTVARIVGDKVRDIFSADQIGILLFERQTNLLHLAYGYDKAHDRYVDELQIKPIPLGKGLTSKVIESRQPLLLGTREEQDVHGHYLPPELKGQIKISESWLGVPIMADEKVLGVVLVEDYRPHIYNENHLRLLQTLSSNMGVAIQNARLFDEAQQRNSELTIINSVQEGLASKLEMQGIYDLVGDKIREISHQSDVGIRVYDSQTGLLHFPYVYENGRRITVDSLRLTEDGFSPHVLRTCETLVINENLSQEMEKYGARMIPGTKLEKSIVFVPLVSGGQARGLVTLGNYEREHAFSESDVRLIETLANSMSVALENARLFDETQRLFKAEQERVVELQVINSIQQGLASKLDMQGIYDLVGDAIGGIFRDAEAVLIYSIDLQSKRLDFNYTSEKGQRFHLDPDFYENRPYEAFYNKLAYSTEPLVINNNCHAFMVESGLYVVEGTEEPKSAIFIPLIAGDRVLSQISLQNIEREYAFTDSDIRLLSTLASAMSVALENARLFEETQQRNAELAIINSVQAALAAQLEIHGIYDAVGEKLREIFSYQDVDIYSADLKTRTMTIEYGFEKGRKFERITVPMNSMYEYLVAANRTFVFNGNVAEFVAQFKDYQGPPAGELSKSVLIVPIHRKKDSDLAVYLTLQDVEGKRIFSDSDVRLLETLANSMSVALENARLWEQEKLYRKALQRELDIGREIQQGFLPEALPSVDGWEIAASLMSAREVAGDFYDAFDLPDGTIGLVIADVCDKGVGAALFMTLFRSLIRGAANLDYFEHTENENPPHSTAERLQRSISLTNNYIAETHGDSGMFATLFFGILDPRTGTLHYINGGHEPPLIIHDGAVRETLRKTGPAVGALENARFDILEMQMQPGDVFFAFTDGVPDCQNPRGEFFGRERLLDFLQRMNTSAPEIVAAVESELHQYIASANQFDDITLLAVKRRG